MSMHSETKPGILTACANASIAVLIIQPETTLCLLIAGTNATVMASCAHAPATSKEVASFRSSD